MVRAQRKPKTGPHGWVSMHQKKKSFDIYVDSLKSWNHKYVVLRALNICVLTYIFQVPHDYQEDCSDSEIPDLDATQESEFVADWRAQNRGLVCGSGSSGALSSSGEVAHVPLFSHFWSWEHQDSSSAEYTYS